MSKEGKQDRDERLLALHSGSWGTHHSMMICVIQELYQLSRSNASSRGTNVSWFTYAGIPLLISALQSFIVEYECLLQFDRTCLEPLTRGGLGGLLGLLQTRYRVQGKLLEEAGDLIEVRNEMVHPVPLPTGTEDNWPAHLRRLKEAGLAETTGQETDYPFMVQLASHRLFAWACRVTRDLFQHVVLSDNDKSLLCQDFVDQVTGIGFDADLP